MVFHSFTKMKTVLFLVFFFSFEACQFSVAFEGFAVFIFLFVKLHFFFDSSALGHVKHVLACVLAAVLRFPLAKTIRAENCSHTSSMNLLQYIFHGFFENSSEIYIQYIFHVIKNLHKEMHTFEYSSMVGISVEVNIFLMDFNRI